MTLPEVLIAVRKLSYISWPDAFVEFRGAGLTFQNHVRPNLVRYAEAPLRAYLRRARAAGIDRTIVMPAFHTDYRTANAQLAEIVGLARPKLIGFAMVHPVRDAGEIAGLLRRAIGEWGFRGIKVHGHDAMPTREVCGAARKLRVPLLVDVFGRAEVVDLLAGEYPDVRFIIPHFGSFADVATVARARVAASADGLCRQGAVVSFAACGASASLVSRKVEKVEKTHQHLGIILATTAVQTPVTGSRPWLCQKSGRVEVQRVQ